MTWHLIEIMILALATLLAPSLALYLSNRSKRRRGRRRRHTDHAEFQEEVEASAETGWVRLPLVLLLSLSLDSYVLFRLSGQGFSTRAVVLLYALTVFVAFLQTMAIALLAALPTIGRKYRELMTALNEGRTDRAAIREMLSAGLEQLEQIESRLNNLSAADAKIQRSLVTRDKGLVALVTKGRDEQAKVRAEQLKAHEEVLGLITVLNQKVRGLKIQVQESFPGRKADVKGSGSSR